MENKQQLSPTQRLQSAFNSLTQGLEKANQKGVFQLSESSALFQSLLLLKQYIETTLQQASQQTPVQETASTENVTMEVKKE